VGKEGRSLHERRAKLCISVCGKSIAGIKRRRAFNIGSGGGNLIHLTARGIFQMEKWRRGFQLKSKSADMFQGREEVSQR